MFTYKTPSLVEALKMAIADDQWTEQEKEALKNILEYKQQSYLGETATKEDLDRVENFLATQTKVVVKPWATGTNYHVNGFKFNIVDNGSYYNIGLWNSKS